ncbi:MAG: hypothetical protein JKX76_03615 [Colwellia sp.]|nr:hypothetical protein [Colwellia sp.]
MIEFLRGIYHRIQLFGRYYQNLKRHSSFTKGFKRSASSITQKVVGFDIESNKFTRHLYNYISFFILSGYTVYIKKRSSFIGNLTDYSLDLLETSNLLFVDRLPEGISLKFCSSEKEGFILLNDNFLSSRKDEDHSLTYPFSMHPMIYKDEYYKEIEELRLSEKSIRLFFAGAIHPDYEHENFNKLFKIMDRVTLFQAFVEHYSSKELFVIETRADLNQLEKGDYLDKLVMIKSGHTHLVYWDKWLALMAKSNFFISMPGVKIPLCHNLIEAMSVGVIPVLQYHNFLATPLENNVNCITFDSKEELNDKIDQIRRMDSSEIKRLRDGVIAYYDHYLKPERFIGAIEEKAEDKRLKNVYLYSELNTVHRLEQEIES